MFKLVTARGSGLIIFSLCFGVTLKSSDFSVHDQPQVLYKFPKKSKQQKIEDALLCQSPLDKTLSSPSEHKPCLLALTADNWLCRISAETGKELQRLYLSPKYKFKYI
uniref:Uncharacterized protein n=1 Tax=Fundulus heteroclitus TaxID=8078 RepID=A0A3Q2QWA4_FUNHE